MVGRPPRRYLNVTFACSVSLSTTIHEQHIPLAPAPPWPDPAAVPSLTTGRCRVRARLCALRRLWLHAGCLVHNFARAPRPCVALRGAQRAQERLRRERQVAVVHRDRGTLYRPVRGTG